MRISATTQINIIIERSADQTVMDTVMLQMPQVLPSAIQPNPSYPQSTPQLFFIRQPWPLLYPTIIIAWSSWSLILQSLKTPES